MSFNYLGLIIFIIVYIPKSFIFIFQRKLIHLNKHKQLEIIEFICLMGCLFFGFVNIEYGYRFINTAIEITYVSIISVISIVYYLAYLRFLISKRKIEYVYKSFLFIPLPITLCECMILLISGYMLMNPYVAFFSTLYLPIHIYLDYQRSKGVI